MSALSNILGYILNFIYTFVHNYGLALILFTLLIKLILLPISLKQQKTMKKSSKIQVELKEIQEKYKNDQVKANQEMMNVYKRENMSPMSGCLSSIIQIILLFAVFYLVRSPLTYMKKVDPQVIDQYKQEIAEESTTQSAYPEVQIIKEKGPSDERVYVNMNFLGLDLSSVPQANLTDYKVYIIPALYIISSIASMKLTLPPKAKKEKIEEVEENEQTKEDKDDDSASPEESMENMSRTMSFMMPIMAVSISLVAPLGLALYWLVNNISMIVERVCINKFMKDEEEKA